MGYSRNLRAKGKGEHGIDIKVRHNQYPRYFIVEVKGDPDPKKVKHPASRREVTFNYVIGQIISRMRYKAKYNYGIGLPISHSDKIFRRLPWQVCKKLGLYTFLVSENGKVDFVTWKDLKKYQKEL